MTCKELNEKLLVNFPELEKSFEEETSWQEGMETGSTVVYEDVFVPFVEEAIEKGDDKAISRIFGFIEELAQVDDEYTRQLLMICIFDNLVFFDDELHYEKWLGPNSLALFKQSQKEQ